MASEKMIEAAKQAKADWLRYRPDSVSNCTIEDAVITVAIDAAWTRFDVKDQSTWPKSDYDPSGHPWLLRNLTPDGQRVYMASDRFSSWWGPVTDYADPADLMPSWITEKDTTS